MFSPREFVEVSLQPDEYRLGATIRHVDGQHLLIAVAQEDAALIAPGATVHLAQVGDGGMYQFETSVINRRDNMFVAKMGRPELVQRRRFARLACNLEAGYEPKLTLLQLQQASLADMRSARAMDISMGGAKIAVGELVMANATLGARVALSEAELIDTEVSVVRCSAQEPPIATPTGNLPFLIAVQFLNVSRIHQVQLHRFCIQHSGKSR